MTTRHERVIIDLDDRFTRPMAGMAASTAAFRRNLDSADRDVTRFNRDVDKAGPSIDRLSGRMRILADVAAVLGPSLVPVGAVAIPAVTGLAAQFGFAAVGAGTALVAFQGVGTALEAVNKAALEPTQANLEAARIAMEEISPAARDLVGQLREMQPALKGLRDTAASGMFPGLVDGLESMERVLPKVNGILSSVSVELGDIARDVGASFASGRWDDFLTFLATDAPSALRDMSQAAGDVTHGLAEMWMAFDPLNDDFSRWMVNAADDFDRWATGLDQTEGFQEFVDYIRSVGPQVADTLGALGNALVQILQAAAPIGGPVLAGIEAFAKAIAAIADSDLGTPIFGMVAAMSALNLAMRTSAALSRTTFGGPVISSARRQGAALRGLRADWAAYSAVQRTAAGRAQASAGAMMAHRDAAKRLGATVRSTAATMGKGAAAIGGLAVATTGVGDKMGFTNTVALGLLGTLAGPWGAAVGAGAGLLIDMAHAGDDVASSLARIDAAAKGGNLGKATSELSALEAKQRDVNDVSGFGDFFSDIGKSGGASLLQGLGKLEVDGIDKARKSVKDLKAELADNKAAQATAMAATMAGRGFLMTGAGAKSASMSVTEFRNSILAANAALTRQGTMDAYAASLLDAKDALEANGKTLARNTRAGLANRAALRQMAGSALEYAGNMKNAARRTEFMDKARGDFIRMAKAFGMAPPAARRAADAIGLVDQGSRKSSKSVSELRSQIRQLKSKVVEAKERGAKESSPRVRALREQIAKLQGKVVTARAEAVGKAQVDALRASIAAVQSKSVTITTITRRRSGGNTFAATAHADGGFIAGPGGPRDDAIPAWLSNGEFVVNAAATSRFRSELEWMNAQKFATGGAVGASASSVSVSAPVSMAGTQITAVFPGIGQVVGRVVDERIADHVEQQTLRSRTSG